MLSRILTGAVCGIVTVIAAYVVFELIEPSSAVAERFNGGELISRDVLVNALSFGFPAMVIVGWLVSRKLPKVAVMLVASPGAVLGMLGLATPSGPSWTLIGLGAALLVAAAFIASDGYAPKDPPE